MGTTFTSVQTDRVVNVASVPQRSPFRYPGGKTWLVPYVRLWLGRKSQPFRQLVEPFAGGAIVGLTAAFEGLARKVTLVELDADVASVWRTITKGDARWLADRVANFKLSPQSAKEVFSSTSRTLKERAFVTIVRNRAQRGGILAPGAGLMKHGENGRGIASRWYPETLQRRILDIARIRSRLNFIQGDGLSYIEKNVGRKNVAFFIDPPYTVAGRRLYRHSEVDHEKLFGLAKRLESDFVMTYDDSQEIRRLVIRFRLDCETVVMKNTHNSTMVELLIGRDLKWLRSPETSGATFREFFLRRQLDWQEALQ